MRGRRGFLAVAEFMSATMFTMLFFLLTLSFAKLYIARFEVREASRSAAFAALREEQRERPPFTSLHQERRLSQRGFVFKRGESGRVIGGGASGRSSIDHASQVELPPTGRLAPTFMRDVFAAGLIVERELSIQLPTAFGLHAEVGRAATARVVPLKPGVLRYTPGVITKGITLEAMPADARTAGPDLHLRLVPEVAALRVSLPWGFVVP